MASVFDLESGLSIEGFDKKPSPHTYTLIHRGSTSSSEWLAVSEDHVNWSMFVEMLVLHLFLPLSTIPYVFVRGLQSARNLNLFSSDCQLNLVTVSFAPLTIMANLALYFSFRPAFERCGVDIMEVFFVPVALTVMHRAMIALKYAFMTDEDRQCIFSVDTLTALAINRKVQLLTGWAPLSDEVMCEELHIASVIAGVDLFQGSFSHEVREGDSSEASRSWRSLLRLKEEERDEEGQDFEMFSIPPDAMLRYLMRMAVNVDVSSQPKSLVQGFVIVVAFLPLLIRAWDACYVSGATAQSVLITAFGASSPVVLFSIVSSVLTTYILLNLACRFMLVGVSHYRRMYLVLHWLTVMIRPVFSSHSSLPQLQLDDVCTEGNVMALVRCVSVVTVFGGRFQKRVEAYVAAILGVSLVGLAHFVLRVVFSGPGQSPRLTAFVAQVLLFIFVNSLLIFHVIILAASANDTVALMSARLVDARWRACTIANGPKVEKDVLRRREDVINAAVARLDRSPQTHPVTIAGMTAREGIGYGFLAIVSTTVASVVVAMSHLALPGFV